METKTIYTLFLFYLIEHTLCSKISILLQPFSRNSPLFHKTPYCFELTGTTYTLQSLILIQEL